MKTRIAYVTASRFKREEIATICTECLLSSGDRVGDVFEFDIREVPILETLQVDLAMIVQAEVTAAYSQIRVPCIVEHAGLIFENFRVEQYPGGLTKPMWKALGSNFVSETQSAGRRAVARAVVGYCDGMTVQTFLGETTGTIATGPRGARDFYWDTIFMPDVNGAQGTETYAEIVADPARGLAYKIRNFSQSAKAILSFLEFRRNTKPSLWK